MIAVMKDMAPKEVPYSPLLQIIITCARAVFKISIFSVSPDGVLPKGGPEGVRAP